MNQTSAKPQMQKRGLWGSKLGFILAASGSAIGLGNIVFFGANAYRYGGGAFYVPYFVALLALGIPMMIVEFGIGKTQRGAFPMALRKTAGAKGEFIGWWSLLNATIIAMYYVTVLAWVAAMMLSAFGELYAEGRASVGKTFGGILETWLPAMLAVAIWALNLLFLSRGTRTIEKTVKVFVPLMWLFMLVLVVRGLTLDTGLQGVWYLFTPDFSGITKPAVWQGAFSQMFFSLSLGLGTMTAYASYLPKKADVVTNSSMVSFLNCSFEFIAGVAIFSMLFAYSLYPGESTGTLGMSLVVIPSGIADFPAARELFAFLFFLLLLVAGLTSSISIIESPVSALCDKFGWSRGKSLMFMASFGVVGSIAFALPLMFDSGGKPAATSGLLFLELFDHWSFGYSLLVVGLVEALLIGWVYGIGKLRDEINVNSRIHLGPGFDMWIKYVVPLLLLVVLTFNVLNEVGVSISIFGLDGDGFFTAGAEKLDNVAWLPKAVFGFWFIATIGGAIVLTTRRRKEASL